MKEKRRPIQGKINQDTGGCGASTVKEILLAYAVDLLVVQENVDKIFKLMNRGRILREQQKNNTDPYL